MSATSSSATSKRRVCEQQDWPLPTRLTDPLLGLGYEQLTELFQQTGLPEGWSRAYAAEIAVATQAVISRQIGLMSTGRARWTGVAKALVGVCLAERWQEGGDDCDMDFEAHLEHDDRSSDRRGVGSAIADSVVLPTPFDEMKGIQDLLLADPTVGWGNGSGGLRRLYEHTVLCGPFPVTAKRGESRSWALSSSGDFATLDHAFGVEATKTRPLLPVAACAAFASPRRTVFVDGLPEPVELPSLWEFVATLLVWGADEARLRLLEFLNEEAAREVSPRRERPDGGTVADTTLNTTASQALSWMLRAFEVAPAYPRLRERWSSKPIAVSLEELQQTVATWRAERTAVPLLLYRRKRLELIAAVEQHRRRDGSLDPTCVFRALKRLVFFLLLGELSARIGEIARLSPASFIKLFEHGGYTTPAFVLQTSKRGRRVGGPSQQIKPVTALTASYFTEFLMLCGIGLDDTQPFWMAQFAYRPQDGGTYAVENRRPGPRMGANSLSNALVRSIDGKVEPLLSRPAGGGYAAHSFRHLGSQVSSAVGTGYFQHHPDLMVKISHEVFSAAQLGHQLQADRLGYRDLEANRTLWALKTALGDPSAGIPGVLDVLTGDAGARRGWDIDSIRGTLIRLRLARQRVDQISQKLTGIRLERLALRDEPLPPVPTQHDKLPVGRKLDLMLSRDVARERRARDRDILDDRIEQAHEDRDAAQTTAEAVAAELAAIRQAGHTHPLPDYLPTADEVRERGGDPGYALDQETWEQALARADVRLALLALEPAPISIRLRHELNLPEFAAVLGMSAGGLRKRLRGEHEPFFLLDGRDSPLIVLGDRATSKLRFIDVDKLPESFLRQLLPEQREMIDQLLAVPMGSTQWGGRQLTL